MALPRVHIVVDDVGMVDEDGGACEFLVLMKRGDVALAATACFDGRAGIPHSRTMSLDWRALPADAASGDD
jgi:hypothetical protein